jgi:hypothetical protein
MVLCASVIGHAAVFAPALGRPRDERALEARSLNLAQRAEAVARPVVVAAERRELVEEARADRAAGRLALGAFLLRASAIDAREAGRRLDLDRARQLYEDRLARLREAGGDVRDAIPAVFGDLHYYGRPGGSMGEALLEGGGSCEPLSHLIAAALYDTGHGARARLRFYGGEGDSGATHLAPVYGEGRDERDLLTGAPARRGGALFAAEDLVEAYARAHDLAPPIDAGGAGGDDDGDGDDGAPAVPPAVTLARGYPPNRDRFPGTTPLYADRAVQAPSEPAATATVPSLDGSDCAFFVRVAALDPPILGVADPDGGAFGVELRRVPTGAQLDRIFNLVQAVERTVRAGGSDEPADRLMDLACLTALYDRAVVGFELTGERELAQLAAERGRKAAAEGEALLAGVDLRAPAGERMLARLAERYAGKSWLLLLLRGGDAAMLRLGADASHSDWGRTSLLAALLVAPRTRRAALALVEGLNPRQKLSVMHEVFHAHDHQRPWASNYALDDAGDGEFARVYRVFRGLAWGLWEGARPPVEVLDTLLREAERERIGRPWIVALLDYYGRNALALHQSRADGRVFSGTLKRWLRVNGFGDLDLYRRDLAGVHEPT